MPPESPTPPVPPSPNDEQNAAHPPEQAYATPEYLPDDAPDKGLSAVEPLPPEGQAEGEIMLPPAASTMRGDAFGPAVLVPQSLTPQALPVEPDLGSLPGHPQDKPPAQDILSDFVPDQALSALWERIERAKKRIDEEINNTGMAGLLLDQLKFARNEILGGKANYEEAERYINEVEFRLAFYQRMRAWSRSLGVFLFAYEVVWGAALLAFVLLGLGAAAFTSGPRVQLFNLPNDYIYLLATMSWGALGGVIGAMLALVKHISWEQNFDRQHSMWYLTSPIVGIAVGAVVFLIIRTGLLSITGSGEAIHSPLIIYLLACLTGYQQNIFTRLVKRLLQAFRLDDSADSAAPESPARS